MTKFTFREIATALGLRPEDSKFISIYDCENLMMHGMTDPDSHHPNDDIFIEFSDKELELDHCENCGGFTGEADDGWDENGWNPSDSDES